MPLPVKRLTDVVGKGKPKPLPIEFLVEGIMAEEAAGLLVGSSGKGKTPFLVQLGICVSAGIPFLGRATKKKKVLFIDAESMENQYDHYLWDLCEFLKITEPTQDDFWMHSTKFHKTPVPMSNKARITSVVKDFQPGFLVLDCLRPLFGAAEKDSEEAAQMWAWLESLNEHVSQKMTILLVHHTRKSGRHQGKVIKVNPLDDQMTWFEETSGHSALINQANVRLGWDFAPGAGKDALVLFGYSKATGEIEPLHLDRVKPDGQHAVGYTVACERMFEKLNDRDIELWRAVEQQPRFTPGYAKDLLNVSSFGTIYPRLNRLVDAGLLKKKKIDGKVIYERQTPSYVRVRHG